MIAACPKVTEVAVYGVSVPRADGRAGMAALVVEDGFDLGELRRTLAAHLPAYARPVFIRIVATLEITGTFKLRKQELALEGYDPLKVRDPLYIEDGAQDAYVPLDAALHQSLEAGQLRL